MSCYSSGLFLVSPELLRERAGVLLPGGIIHGNASTTTEGKSGYQANYLALRGLPVPGRARLPMSVCTCLFGLGDCLLPCLELHYLALLYVSCSPSLESLLSLLA